VHPAKQALLSLWQLETSRMALAVRRVVNQADWY
jgi:hypothetical protein